MIHRVGHSLGVDVHDSQPRSLFLKPGMVVTVEPGTYHSGKFGIRIEDDILVTKGKPVVLTRSPKTLIEIR
jgi:Xaa-Pro dipeptidase